MGAAVGDDRRGGPFSPNPTQWQIITVTSMSRDTVGWVAGLEAGGGRWKVGGCQAEWSPEFLLYHVPHDPERCCRGSTVQHLSRAQTI